MRRWRSRINAVAATRSAVVMLSLFLGTAQAQVARKKLTVEAIYGEPSLSGELTSGLEWKPDGTQLSYFQTSGSGAKATTELWGLDTTAGERRRLIPAESLLAAQPQEPAAEEKSVTKGRRAFAPSQWSPDGSGLLFAGSRELVWFDLKTQEPRKLVSGKQLISDAKISPDGRWVSFVRDYNLWLVNRATMATRQLTRGGSEQIRKGQFDWVYAEEFKARTGYWWSPDSVSIAFMEMDERKVTEYPIQDFLSSTGEITTMRYPQAGGANPVVHVYIVPVAGGSARLMDSGEETDIYLPRVNWLPDGKHLAIQRLNRKQDKLDLLVAESATGRSRVVLSETDQYWINVSSDLHFLADGKRFFWSSERTGYRHLFLYDLQGKQLAQLTSGEWEVSEVAGINEKEQAVYFSAKEKSPLESHLYRVSFDGSGFSRVTKQDGIHEVRMAPGAAIFLDTYSNAATPPSQRLYRVDGSLLAALNENQVPQLADYGLSPVEFLTIRSSDGVPLNAMMIKPPDFAPSRKYPVIVYTYGGPGVQIVLNGWGGSSFLWNELMAQKGYIIFALDNRGSSGRGHLFEEPIHTLFGGREVSDQYDGLLYLRSLPYVDGNRFGIWGWDYGGLMSLFCIFKHPLNFKVAFAGAPVTDWRLYDSIYTERYLRRPQENDYGYVESSPARMENKFRGKLLIAQGTADEKVHLANSLELVQALIEDKKYAELALFPGGDHNISDPDARIVLFRRVTQFFLDNL
jgi:dipeptidyl-peptidase-4